MKSARLARITEYLEEYKSKGGFFQKACDLALDKAGYLWIGVYFVFNGELRRTAFAGEDDGRPSFNIGEGNVGFSAKHGSPRSVPDVRLDGQFIPRLPGAKSELAIPIIDKGKVVGTIDCLSDRANYFTTEDMDFLKKLAEMCLSASKHTLTL